jgi:hypothetical protein
MANRLINGDQSNGRFQQAAQANFPYADLSPFSIRLVE